MKLTTLILTTALLSSAAFADTSAVKEEGVKYIKMLGGTLKSQLQKKMKEDPTGMAAAAFCAGSADKITKKVNSELPAYASVRRTALKVRNEGNKPDAIDEKVMKEYTKAIEEKKFNPKSAIKVVEDGETARIYKPLLAKAVCLKCHGSNVSPEISELINKQYPADQATGFKEGDLRGVIVSEIKKH